MKKQNKPHFVIMATIVAVFAALTWSCNKDDDPSLSDLREDKLQFLQDSLRISDSLRLTNNAGVVNYAVTVVDGSVSSLYANSENNGRTEKTMSAVDGAVVTISQYGKTQTDTTDASGMVVFNGFFRSAVNITVNKTDYTSVSYISGVNITDSTRTGTISFVGNIVPIFAKTGPNTATISGRATIQTDLTNKTRELVADGTSVSASIDASNTSAFANKFLTLDIDDKIFKASCGCQFIYVGYILQASYNAGVVGAVAGGNYTLTVPAAVDGLPMILRYSDVAADQTLFEEVAAGATIPGDRTATYRTYFSPQTASASLSTIPSGSGIDIDFETYTTAAQATAVISSTTGEIESINVLTSGSGYTGVPAVVITGAGGTGTGATATAVVQNGQVVRIDVNTSGSGYVAPVTATLLSGSGAAASVSNLAQDGTVSVVQITNSGSGYTTAPNVVFTAPTGAGTTPLVTATGTANLTNGRVTSITITDPGSGYIANPTVTIDPAPAGGTDATGVALYSGQSIGNVQVTSTGANYVYAPSITFVNAAPTDQRPGGVAATGTAVIDPVTRELVGINVTNPGSGYLVAPNIVITSNVGLAATTEVFLSGGSVISVDISNQGAGYIGTPLVKFSGGNGTGATGTAMMADGKVVGVTIIDGGSGYTTVPDVDFVSGVGAVGFATVNAQGQISAITVTDGGHGYTAAPRVVIDVAGNNPGGGAVATAVLTGSAVGSVTVDDGGSGYLEGNTPGAGSEEEFTATKGLVTSGANIGATLIEAKPGINVINDLHYGTGIRQEN